MSSPSSEPEGHTPTAAPGDQASRRPPPRPDVGSAGPPPAEPAVDGRPGALRVSMWLWLASIAAGALGLVTAVVNDDTIRARVTDAALATDPDLAPDVLETGVTATINTLLGMSAALLVVTAVSLAFTLRRTPGLRWVLALAGVLTVALLPLVGSLVAQGTAVDDLAFLVQAGLVVAGLVTLFAGSSRRWLRRPRT